MKTPEQRTQMADILSEARELAGISKYRLAQLTGLSHANIFKVEHGQRFPTPAYLAAVLPHIARSPKEHNDIVIAALIATDNPYEKLLI